MSLLNNVKKQVEGANRKKQGSQGRSQTCRAQVVAFKLNQAAIQVGRMDQKLVFHIDLAKSQRLDILHQQTPGLIPVYPDWY